MIFALLGNTAGIAYDLPDNAKTTDKGFYMEGVNAFLPKSDPKMNMYTKTFLSFFVLSMKDFV